MIKDIIRQKWKLLYTRFLPNSRPTSPKFENFIFIEKNQKKFKFNKFKFISGKTWKLSINFETSSSKEPK